jgi:hypothetical protein
MKKLILATLLIISSFPAFSATEKEEEFAAKTAATLLLATGKCDLNTFSVAKLMKKTEDVYDVTGVDPKSYPPGEWVRKTFFAITTTGWLSMINNDDPAMVKNFCSTMSRHYPKGD